MTLKAYVNEHAISSYANVTGQIEIYDEQEYGLDYISFVDRSNAEKYCELLNNSNIQTFEELTEFNEKNISLLRENGTLQNYRFYTILYTGDNTKEVVHTDYSELDVIKFSRGLAKYMREDLKDYSIKPPVNLTQAIFILEGQNYTLKEEY